MKKTMCDNTIERFLELDKDENLGLKTSLHLLTCKKCRTVVRLCSIAQRSSARPLHIQEAISNNVTSIIQKANPSIELLKDSQAKPITMKKWLYSGLGIVICFITFAFASPNGTPKVLEFTIYSVFSLILCLYTSFFIGSNLDFFVKIIDKHTKS